MVAFNDLSVVTCSGCLHNSSEEFADSLIYFAHNHSHNDSYDIFNKGCFGDFDTIACVRSGLISALAVITAFSSLIKIVRLHYYKHLIRLQYCIFYFATLECTLCAVHWMLGGQVQLYFAAEYLKLLQLLCVVHMHWLAAARILKKEVLVTRIHVGVTIVTLCACTAILILGCTDTDDAWHQCFKPYALILSTMELCLVQSLVVASGIINKRLNEISTVQSLRRARKRDLWLLIVIFELSAIMSITYDVSVQFLGNTDEGCSGIFKHLQTIYSPVYGTLSIMKFLMPIWVLLCVIQPTEGTRDRASNHIQVISNTYIDWSAEGDSPRVVRSRYPSARGCPPFHRTPSNLATICEESEDGSIHSQGDENEVVDDRRYIIY